MNTALNTLHRSTFIYPSTYRLEQWQAFLTQRLRRIALAADADIGFIRYYLRAVGTSGPAPEAAADLLEQSQRLHSFPNEEGDGLYFTNPSWPPTPPPPVQEPPQARLARWRLFLEQRAAGAPVEATDDPGFLRYYVHARDEGIALAQLQRDTLLTQCMPSPNGSVLHFASPA